jgi:hypothetical protein
MKLEVLIGMIASGKSTYARARADAGALVICHDDLTEMLHARYRYEAELRDMYRAMMTELAELALLAGRDVVIDRTHLTRESRAVWVSFRKEWDVRQGDESSQWAPVELVGVTFPTDLPERHALRRWRENNRGRTYDVWLDVTRHHAGQAAAEPFDAIGEGFDAVLFAPV